MADTLARLVAFAWIPGDDRLLRSGAVNKVGTIAGQALETNGTVYEYMNSAPAISLDDCTVIALLIPTNISAASAQAVCLGSSVDSTPLFMLGQGSVGTNLAFRTRDGGGTDIETQAASSAWTAGAPCVAGGTRSKSNGFQRVYANGKEIANSAVGAAAATTFDRLALGGLLRSTFGSSWSGKILGLYIFPRALSASEMASLADVSTFWRLYRLLNAYPIFTPSGAADTALAGSAVAVASMSGNLTTGIALAGSAAAQATMTGALTTAIALTGNAVAAATASVSLTTAIPLQGSAAAQASMGGALTTAIALTGNAVAAATVSGSLTTAIPLQGSAAAQTSMSGAITTAIALVGSAAANATSSGVLTTHIALAGSATVQATATGVFGVQAAQFVGAAVATCSANGVLSTAITLNGIAVGAAVSGGVLTTGIALRGDATAQCAAIGLLTDFGGETVAYARAPRGGGYSPRPVSAPQRAAESPAGRPAGSANVRNNNCDRGSIR